MYRQRRVEFFRFFVNRPVDLRAEVAFDALAVGRQHGPGHAELFHRAAHFRACGIRVLDRNQRHPFDARADVGEFFVEPIIVRSTGGDGPIFGDDPADGQSRGWIYDGPVDANLVEKIHPFLGSDGAGARALFATLQEMEVDVVECGENLAAISRRHVFGDFVHTGPIVDVAIGVDDLHQVRSLSPAILSRL